MSKQIQAARAERLPDVVHIGLYRAASTFLRGYFSQHPDIHWARTGSYFLLPEWDRQEPYPALQEAAGAAKCFVDMFEALAVGQIFGPEVEWEKIAYRPGASLADISVRIDPEAVAQRIKATLPEAKILFVLRNQEDWLRSAYLHHLDRMPPRTRRFVDFMETPQGKSVALAGAFDRTIGAYQGLFGKDRLHVLLVEQLRAEAEASLRGLCAYFGVPYWAYAPEQENWNLGKGVEQGHVVRLSAALRLDSGRWRRLRPLLRPARRLFAPWLTGDVLSEDERRMIRAVYAASNQRSARLLGLDLATYGYAT